MPVCKKSFAPASPTQYGNEPCDPPRPVRLAALRRRRRTHRRGLGRFDLRRLAVGNCRPPPAQERSGFPLRPSPRRLRESGCRGKCETVRTANVAGPYPCGELRSCVFVPGSGGVRKSSENLPEVGRNGPDRELPDSADERRSGRGRSEGVGQPSSERIFCIMISSRNPSGVHCHSRLRPVSAKPARRKRARRAVLSAPTLHHNWCRPRTVRA